MAILNNVHSLIGAFAIFLVVFNNFDFIVCRRGGLSKPDERDALKICCSGIVHRTSVNEQQMCCGNRTYDVTESVCCFNGSFYQLSLPNATALESLSFLGCCGDEVYDMRLDLCCHGNRISKENATNPLTLSCCGTQSFDTETEVCCLEERVWEKNTTAIGQTLVTQCCGLLPYDPRSSLCCSGNIQENEYGIDGRCCAGEVFNVREEICCGRTQYNRTSASTVCCSDTPFDWDTELCCDGVVHNETEPDAECCGNSTYGYDTGKCCDGELYDYANDTTGVFKISDCCGTFLFDPRKEQCCAGLVIPLRPSAGSHIGCCGSRIYDPSSALCCEHLIVPNTNPNKLCCGSRGRVYDVRSEVCCSDVAVQIRNYSGFENHPNALPGPRNVLCCGASIFDPLREGCCDGVIFEL